MPNLTADEIVTQKHKRNFIQYGGPKPTNPVRYGGQDAQYMTIDGVTSPESGGVDPIFVPDPRRIGAYRLVGRTMSPPDLASASLHLLERHGAIPRQLQSQGCQFNLYELTGKCKDLSDFVGGWTDYVLIYAGAIVTNKDLGARTSWDSDESIETTLDLTLANVYPVGALNFGEKAAAEVSREVADVVYAPGNPCDCDDATSRIYAVTKSSGTGSPGLPAEVIYSTDGGATLSQANIDNLGATEDPLAIDVVGDKLVVIGSGAYYWSTINANTGVPGTWTKVSAGFVANKAPNDLFVLSPREVIFVGDGGYVYRSTDITAGVEVLNAGSATTSNLRRVHGNGDETIVATGAASTVIISRNRGATFATAAASVGAVSVDITAVAVLDELRYWVGTALSGRMYYTLTAGESWVEKSFSGSGSGSVRDITFATSEVAFFSHDTNTPRARIFATINGGADWSNAAPRIQNLATFNRANRIAVPPADASIAANNVAIAGLGGDGTDGILLLGIAARL